MRVPGPPVRLRRSHGSDPGLRARLQATGTAFYRRNARGGPRIPPGPPRGALRPPETLPGGVPRTVPGLAWSVPAGRPGPSPGVSLPAVPGPRLECRAPASHALPRGGRGVLPGALGVARRPPASRQAVTDARRRPCSPGGLSGRAAAGPLRLAQAPLTSRPGPCPAASRRRSGRQDARRHPAALVVVREDHRGPPGPARQCRRAPPGPARRCPAAVPGLARQCSAAVPGPCPAAFCGRARSWVRFSAFCLRSGAGPPAGRRPGTAPAVPGRPGSPAP